MKYMGSKARIAKEIINVMKGDISKSQQYIEPFVGGFNLICEVEHDNKIANDINPYLIALFKGLKEGRQPPPHVTREAYNDAKANKLDDFLTGYIGFCCSYSGKFFGGYAGLTKTKEGYRDYIAEARRNLMKQADKLSNVSFITGKYQDLLIPDNSFIYCVPPYQGTTSYGQSFNHYEFYDWCTYVKNKTNSVIYISEYDAPFEQVWEKTVSSSLSANGKSGGSKKKCRKTIQSIITRLDENNFKRIIHRFRKYMTTYNNYNRTITIDLSRNELLTDKAVKALEDRYLWAGENPQTMFARVACVNSDDDAHAQRLYDYMSNLWFMPATPVLSNAGSEKNLPISCYLSEMDDSLEGIFYTQNESKWLGSRGGGIGVNYSKVREIGATVGSKGQTSGIIPFIHQMDSDTLAISQGNLRRASSAAYLDVSHPEIEEFLSIRDTRGDPNRKSLNIHHGVNISAAFMQAVKEGSDWGLVSPKTGNVVDTIPARKLWEKILTQRLETGEPYLWFVDNANNNRPINYVKNELYSSQSNLCLSGDSELLTKNGYFSIKELAEEGEHTIWNGKEWSKATVFKTGENQELLKVTFSNGSVVKATPYHKFYVKNHYQKDAVEFRTHDLKVGDKLEKFDTPVIYFTDPSAEDFYTNGFFSGDGTHDQSGNPMIQLYSDKRPLADKLSKLSHGINYNSGGDRDVLKFKKNLLKPKFWVPINYSVASKLEWLAGLCDSDGTIANNGTNQQLQIANCEYEFLNEIKKMLNTLGIDAKVRLAREAGSFDLPDGKGSLKEYDCRACYRLLITSYDLYRLTELGFKTHRLKINSIKPQRDAKQHIKVVSIEKIDNEDTYCFNEPIRHRGIVNGVETGNCSEISLTTGIDYNNKRRTAVCCLSSLNIEYFEEWNGNKQFIADVISFLDNNMSHFIRLTHNVKGFERANYSATMERSIGLGVMGFHTFLQKKMIPFEGVMAKVWNNKIFSFIKEAGDEANEALGIFKGPCPDSVRAGTNLRCSHLFAIAPTASISTICGEASPGIEPSPAMTFLDKNLSGKFFSRNKYLDALIVEKAIEHRKEPTWYDDLWSKINANEGSIQNLDEFTELEKAVFKGAYEIDQMWIIELAADRQQYIDQGQSVNVFILPDVDKRTLHKLHVAAHDKGMKGLYYCRSKSVGKAVNISHTVGDMPTEDTTITYHIEPDECLSCQ